VCHVCQFQFLVAPAGDICGERVTRSKGEEVEFEIMCSLKVPRGRQGVYRLLRGSNTPFGHKTSRLNGVEEDDE
tara:strand:+ start:460 stop:681 length:222 start_codon:yes stop_codon:yes gene_type:complete